MNIYHELTNAYRENPDRPIIHRSDGGSWSLLELEAQSARIANVLVLKGLKPGNRVMVQVLKSCESIALYLACLRCGLIYIPLNGAYTGDELSYFANDANPQLLILDDAAAMPESLHLPVLSFNTNQGNSLVSLAHSADEGHSVVARSSADTAAFIYTSGTTGKSRAAMLSHGNLINNARALVQQWRFTNEDTLLHALPIFHVHGLFVALHCALISGARIVLHERFEATVVCEDLPRCTVMMGVPTYYVRLLKLEEFTKERCKTLRLFVSGSAPLLTATFDAFEQRSGHRILERYGMSETNILTSNPYAGERLPETVGYPLPGLDLRIADSDEQILAAGTIGEIQVKGDSVFSGYWQKPDLKGQVFTKDGYFRTGDLGHLEPDGRLILTGRSKDLIISGGLNVYPAEIEAMINAFPGVEESAVIGVPDSDFGERVVAVVVAPHQNSSFLQELQKFLRARLSNFKQPRAFRLLEALPRNTMGKVQKNQLRVDMTIWTQSSDREEL